MLLTTQTLEYPQVRNANGAPTQLQRPDTRQLFQDPRDVNTNASHRRRDLVFSKLMPVQLGPGATAQAPRHRPFAQEPRDALRHSSQRQTLDERDEAPCV